MWPRIDHARRDRRRRGLVLGVFAEDGPTHCSGLPVHRYTAADLRALVGDAEIVVERRSTHLTPAGVEQRFRWLTGRLRR